QISWDPPGPASDGEEARGYVIYRFRQGEALDIDDPRHILNIQFGSTSFIDDTALDSQDYVYVVTAIDRLNNESPASCRISTQLAGLPSRFRHYFPGSGSDWFSVSGYSTTLM